MRKNNAEIISNIFQTKINNNRNKPGTVCPMLNSFWNTQRDAYSSPLGFHLPG
jgi:hypothetical protein